MQRLHQVFEVSVRIPLKGKLWSYSASLIVLGCFITYQLYRYSSAYGIGLVVLTVFHVLVTGLMWNEYRVVRRQLQKQ